MIFRRVVSVNLLMCMQFGLGVCVVERKLNFSSFKTFANGIMLLHVIICLMNCISNSVMHC